MKLMGCHGCGCCQGWGPSGPALEEFLDHRWVCQSAHVPQLLLFMCCNLAQDSAHDLPTPRFWESGSPMDLVRGCKGPNGGSHRPNECIAQVVRRRCLSSQCNIGVDPLAFDLQQRSAGGSAAAATIAPRVPSPCYTQCPSTPPTVGRASPVPGKQPAYCGPFICRSAGGTLTGWS